MDATRMDATSGGLVAPFAQGLFEGSIKHSMGGVEARLKKAPE